MFFVRANKTNGARSRPRKSTMDTVDVDGIKLPGCFIVKYLGVQDASGLWGLKHTRAAVDDLVSGARSGTIDVPMLKLEVNDKAVTVAELRARPDKAAWTMAFPIECISYGVQDVTYTKVVAMIVVKECPTALQQDHPFKCHVFVCESKLMAKRLTLTLAAAFREFSQMVKTTKTRELYTKKFAIDLRREEEKDSMPEDSEA
ncbi:uncharacterized protein LOC135383712 [Ornithodoros turicata]|uniref:uncharacterized protein LOC135383712 n=1 Tax=Ornithodoros turicata TaxID=34597 RepID=UPI003138E2F2